MSWLTERLTQQRLSIAFPSRALYSDFEDFLAEPGARLGDMLRHIGLEAPHGFLDSVARHPLLTRNAKDQAAAYSAGDRAERMRQSRQANAREIRRGRAWLERVARAYPEAAATMSA